MAGATDSITKEIRIDASCETVFSFFTDPEKMILWKGTLAKLDPRTGGEYRVNVTGRDTAVGEYVEVVPYSRVSFTWGWEGEGHPVPPGSTLVEVTLRPEGHATMLTLRHSGLSTLELREQHSVGWDHYTERLAIVAAGGDPGVDPWINGTPPA